MSTTTSNVHVVALNVPVHPLECCTSFKQLDANEQRYVHHLTKAAWAGSRICIHQASTESPDIFGLLQTMFSLVGGATALREKCMQPPYAVSAEAITAWLAYTTTFYGNLGNYYASGDLKLVPQCSEVCLFVSTRVFVDPRMVGWYTPRHRSCASQRGGGGGFRPAGQPATQPATKPATQPATIALYMHVCLTALALKISIIDKTFKGRKLAILKQAVFVLCNIQNMSRCLHVPYMPYTPCVEE